MSVFISNTDQQREENLIKTSAFLFQFLRTFPQKVNYVLSVLSVSLQQYREIVPSAVRNDTGGKH